MMAREPERNMDMLIAALLIMLSLVALSVWISSSQAVWGLVVMAASCLCLVGLILRMVRLGRPPGRPQGQRSME